MLINKLQVEKFGVMKLKLVAKFMLISDFLACCVVCIFALSRQDTLLALASFLTALAVVGAAAIVNDFITNSLGIY